MGTARNMTFTEGDVVHVDGGRFIGCRFEDAVLVYEGGEHPQFENCTFERVGWRFDSAALRTILFLQGMNGTDAGRALVEQMLGPGRHFVP